MTGSTIDCRDNLPDHPHLSEPRGQWLWHIGVCQPGQDHLAAAALRNRRYRVYRPIVPVTALDRRKETFIKWRSMFPGYLFVLPAGQSWELLRTAPGMIYGDAALLRQNNQLVTIADDHQAMQLVRETERERSNLETPSEPKFRVGDRVQIVKEPWVNFWATIESLDNEAKIYCLIEMLGRKVRASVHLDHLRA